MVYKQTKDMSTYQSKFQYTYIVYIIIIYESYNSIWHIILA